jgi:starch synthase (maltosyl-transferring)
MSAVEPIALPRTRPPRAAIEAVAPSVDCGSHPVKREIGGEIVVEADCFAEGHDDLEVTLQFRH